MILRSKDKIKTILQLHEGSFKGNHGEKLIGVLKYMFKTNTILIKTSEQLPQSCLEIAVLNSYLKVLRRDNIVAINIILN